MDDASDDDLEPVGRVAPRRFRSLWPLLGLALLAAAAAATVRVRASRRREAETLARLADVRDFLAVTVGEGFSPAPTPADGLALPEVVAAIRSWGLAFVVWQGDAIFVENGDASFRLPAVDASGRPFRFRKPGAAGPWEVFAGDLSSRGSRRPGALAEWPRPTGASGSSARS